MASCLGLYIEEDIIKYAKVSKDNDIIKIDSFGIKFYDKLSEAIQQVIEETYSYKTPISINTANENYNYFYVFNLLNKKDMHSYIKTEFESVCFEKEQNVDVFDTRYVLVNDLENKEKIKAIHISVNKGEIVKRSNLFEKYKLTTISPVALNISNLLEVSKENTENIAIVNIENETTVTTIIDQKIYDITKISSGTKEILDRINAKENSYSKAYEICKNSTIYTSEGKELQYEENIYLDDIMPTLYNIVGQVKAVIDGSLEKISKVYITGTASVINNIDIYFQEYLDDTKVEILRPYFVHLIGTEINIKDYIEVNSAIALAMQGLGEGLRGINFKKESLMDKLPDWMTKEIGPSKSKNKEGKSLDFSNFKLDFKDALTNMEKRLIRGVSGTLLLIIVYGIFSSVLFSQIKGKEEETAASLSNVRTQIVAVNSDKTKVDKKTNEYDSMVQVLEENSKAQSENRRLKFAIPNLLNQIMYVIPRNIQLTSITNSGTKIIINAQSDKYEGLGIFIAKLNQDGILANVVSDTSQKTNGIVTVRIEGELP